MTVLTAFYPYCFVSLNYVYAFNLDFPAVFVVQFCYYWLPTV